MMIIVIIELDVYTPASTRGECRTGHILLSKCFVDKRDWELSMKLKKKRKPKYARYEGELCHRFCGDWNLLNWEHLVEAREARCQTVLDVVCITHLFTCRLRHRKKKNKMNIEYERYEANRQTAHFTHHRAHSMSTIIHLLFFFVLFI